MKVILEKSGMMAVLNDANCHPLTAVVMPHAAAL